MGKEGQQIAEYALLFAIVVGAIFTMQDYVKQRLQGSIAYRSNTFEDAIVLGFGGSSRNPRQTITSQSVSSTLMEMQNGRAGNVTMTTSSSSDSTVR